MSATPAKKRKCHLNENLRKEFPFITIINQRDDSVVKCTMCSVAFSLAVGGRSSITKHVESNKHQNHLTSASTSQKVTDFLPSKLFGEVEKNLAAAEGVTAYHTVMHNHSFRSMDCSSELNRILYNKKFHCARTKAEAIIRNVFQVYAQENLKSDLEAAKFVTLLSDASNHKDTKLYPVLVRYFNFERGIQTKVLNLKAIDGETSEIISNHLKKTVDDHNLNDKVIAMCADNTNTNFGGITRKGDNNVHKKMMHLLGKNIIGIGCNAHIVSNAINTASSLMSIDVEVIIPQIYLYFERFTVRVASLKSFCEEVSVEYKKLLGYSKTRWLALMPAVERVLQLFEPLKSYFLSLEKCPVILKTFFSNEYAEVTLYFIHNQAALFQSVIKHIEKQNITSTEVALQIEQLKEQLQSRLDCSFLPLVVTSNLNKLEESNPRMKKKFTTEAMNFTQTALDYLQNWTKNDDMSSLFDWVLLLDGKIQWDRVIQAITFAKEKFDIIIDDNLLFDEVRRINNFLQGNNCTEETEIDKKWIKIFDFLKQQHIPSRNITILVEMALSLPGTNANVERTFSICNDYWTSEKSRLSVDTLQAIIIVKINIDEDCISFLNTLKQSDRLLKEIHKSNKY